MGKRNIKFIIFHCTAGNQRNTVKDIINCQLAGINHWSIGGYHYLVTADGKVHYLIPESENSNGVKNFKNYGGGGNSTSINICYTGGDTGTNKGGITHVVNNGKNGNKNDAKKTLYTDNRTSAQRNSLAQLASEMKAKYPNAKIIGHYQVSPDGKNCPCFNAEEEYKNIPPAKKITNYGTALNYKRNGSKIIDYTGKQVGTVVDSNKKYNGKKIYTINWGNKSSENGVNTTTNNSENYGYIPGYGIPSSKATNLSQKQKSWIIEHRNKWKTFLSSHGESNADKLSVFFAIQDAYESGYGTSSAAKKYNYGGMMSGGKILEYKSFDDYANKKLGSINAKFSQSKQAVNIGDYARMINDPYNTYLYCCPDEKKGKIYNHKTKEGIKWQYEVIYNYVKTCESIALGAGFNNYVGTSKYVIGKGNSYSGSDSIDTGKFTDSWDNNYIAGGESIENYEDVQEEGGILPNVSDEVKNSMPIYVTKSQAEQFKLLIEGGDGTEGIVDTMKQYPDTITEKIDSTYETYKTIVDTISKTQVKIPLPELPNPMDIVNNTVTGFKQAGFDIPEEANKIYDRMVIIPDGETPPFDEDNKKEPSEIQKILLDLISPATDFIKDAPKILDEYLFNVKKTASGTIDNYVQIGNLIVTGDTLYQEIEEPDDQMQKEIEKAEVSENAGDENKVSIGQILNTTGNILTGIGPGVLGAGLNTVNGIADIGLETSAELVGLAMGSVGAVTDIITRIPGATTKIIAYVMKQYVFGSLNKIKNKAEVEAKKTSDNTESQVDGALSEVGNNVNNATNIVNNTTQAIGNDTGFQAFARPLLPTNDEPTFVEPTPLISKDNINVYSDEFKTAIGSVSDTIIEKYENSVKDSNQNNLQQIETNSTDTKLNENSSIDDILKSANTEDIVSKLEASAAAAKDAFEAEINKESNSDNPHVNSIEIEEFIENKAIETNNISKLQSELFQTFELDEKEISVKLYTETRKAFLELMPEIKLNQEDKTEDEIYQENKTFINMASFATLKIVPAMIEYINDKFKIFEEKINNTVTQIIEEKLASMTTNSSATE